MAKHHEIIHYPHQKRGALRFLRRNIINKQRWNSPTETRDFLAHEPMLSAKVKVIVVAFGAWPSLPSIKWWLLPPARAAQCRCCCRCVMGVICIESSFEDLRSMNWFSSKQKQDV